MRLPEVFLHMPEMVKSNSEKPVKVVIGGGDDAGADSQEYLTFMLGNEEYGIDILKVQEIRGYDNVTRVPSAPVFIKGLINLRGLIVPIVDMRIKFKLGIPSYDHLTTVIILDINGRFVGIVVSGVSDVINITPRQIQSLPNNGSTLKSEYLLGLCSIGERMVILIDVDRLMLSEEIALKHGTDEVP
ncbi:MAG: chemotaxis protein CheW [Candidatus Methylumidiphilus sp.]